MADMNTLIQTLVSGALTGGAGAATTIIAFFKDARKRIETLEKALGNPGSSIDPRTGIYLVLEQIGGNLAKAEEFARKLRKEVDGWEDDPPDWAVRLMRSGGGRQGSFTNEAYHDLEARMDQRYRQVVDRLQEVENTVDQTMRRLRADYVERSAYEEDRRKREEELRKVKDNLHTANGFLRGVMAALGYLEDSQVPQPSDAPPPIIPRAPLPPKPKGR